MDAAEPAVERDERAAVGLAVEDRAAAVGEHDLLRREAVAPGERPGLWIPSTGAPQFDLTLRLYHPGAELRDAPERSAMPEIARLECAR